MFVNIHRFWFFDIDDPANFLAHENTDLSSETLSLSPCVVHGLLVNERKGKHDLRDVGVIPVCIALYIDWTTMTMNWLMVVRSTSMGTAGLMPDASKLQLIIFLIFFANLWWHTFTSRMVKLLFLLVLIMFQNTSRACIYCSFSGL